MSLYESRLIACMVKVVPSLVNTTGDDVGESFSITNRPQFKTHSSVLSICLTIAIGGKWGNKTERQRRQKNNNYNNNWYLLWAFSFAKLNMDSNLWSLVE